MHVTNWAATQREDPVLDAVLHWIEAKKKIGVEESSEFHDSPECPLSTLHAQRGE